MKNQIINNPNTAKILLAAAVFIMIVLFCLVVGFSLVIPLVLFLVALYLFYMDKAQSWIFLRLGLLLALIVFITNAVMSYTSISIYYIPVPAVAMLVVLLLDDLQLAFISALVSSMTVGLLAGNRFDLTMVYFTGSLIGALCVKGARTRGKLINSFFFVVLVQATCVMLFHPNKEFIITKDFVSLYLQPLFVNGILSALGVMATLKIFENLFGVVTNFSLLELSDFNHPLLKRMILECPGTYHHSLFVSNMSEAAADSIGANALLARVGAYYHDIGKLEKPEYFTENQIFEHNRHDDLEPSMSRLVILKHVKNGLDMAKRYKLNPVITDFITQHHGTSLMYYFYQKAVADTSENSKVNEEDFRYPGPKPQSRETAIVLLADSVEGACRALEDPTPTRIEETVSKIINNKFIDGQLDECNLTLKDLERINATFSRILSGAYHTRVKYPEKKDANTNNRKKSPEEHSSPSNSSDPKNPKDSLGA
jgi:cyclic-di-AMP phosphodiesterase PgpH